ncbi:MAG: efflux RND transporter periplasmic adaptor subunit [Candidatus Aceula lacicola]|nr:efflux RND transporter periplasmic adaptor subunit [Candidatus Aceula lacicola]
MKKENIIRISCYLFFLALFVSLIILRQGEIRKELDVDTISIINDWKIGGKPVAVSKVSLKDVDVYTKLTVVFDEDGIFKSYVGRNVVEKLSVGQSVYLDKENKKILGTISSLSKEEDLDTGLYCVEIISNDKFFTSKRNVCHARVGAVKQSIVVPGNIVEFYQGKNFVWKVVDGQAKKVEVNIKECFLDECVVDEGLDLGDLIVIYGHTMLDDESKIKIINDF